ncbi:MAG: hypothetical protein WA058_02125 [Minisyncoccia bacterium]
MTNNGALIVLIVLAGFAYLRYAPDSLKPWTNAPQPAIQPKDPAVKIERVIIPGPERVRVIEKIKYIDKIPGVITPSTVQDNAAHVIASATIPPSVAGGTASAILRAGPDGVGVGSIEYKPATPRFWAIQKEFGIRAGMGTGGLVVGELYARPLRIGPIVVEVRGWGKRDDRSGADFGGAALIDYRF